MKPKKASKRGNYFFPRIWRGKYYEAAKTLILSLGPHWATTTAGTVLLKRLMYWGLLEVDFSSTISLVRLTEYGVWYRDRLIINKMSREKAPQA